jgi:hypothetical protein
MGTVFGQARVRGTEFIPFDREFHCRFERPFHGAEKYAKRNEFRSTA